MAEVRRTNVKGCASCGRDHHELPFHRIPHPPGVQNAMEWYARCPDSGAPLFVRDIPPDPPRSLGDWWKDRCAPVPAQGALMGDILSMANLSTAALNLARYACTLHDGEPNAGPPRLRRQ